MKPKISVILSVYNSEKYLKSAIASILSQTFKNFEFLIINDASTDNSNKILKNFGVKDKRIMLINNKKRLGLTKSLNKAIRLAQGKYIARMDADDISLKNRLDKQISFLEKNQDIAVLGSWVVLIDEKGRELKVKKTLCGYKNILRNIIKANPFVHPTLVFRKEVFDKVGLYDESFLYAQDHELILRIVQKFKADNYPEVLLKYRVSAGNSISLDKLKKQEYYSIKARIKAISKMGYPWRQSIYLVKPFLSFLIPAKFKLWIYKKIFWNKNPSLF